MYLCALVWGFKDRYCLATERSISERAGDSIGTGRTTASECARVLRYMEMSL